MEMSPKQFRKRNAILSYLRESKSHPSAEMVFTDLKQQIENMVIPAKITSDSFEEVKKRVDELILQANQLLERHRLQQRQEWNVQNDHLKSVVRENKGVCLSNKVFWWVIGIFEVAV